ncbi:MAG: SMP-30/gluconolactonase/LRE family protein [Rhodospirillaceae bacterium]|jgi:sugar lactone lactonase YvrE|nr:SMP-30/gluconolactonase/LRE family protein [Rhodospirillaceae bacterium]MBT3883842.1 SMP-30/gluconolactonase/LRE family protein [Rhodospirillaceae bacterium]MBT4117813.1 SMP-30/gluconolactonase/LRE family protein [Rhodospirillaceae bacterium]MBT4672941.1 SMP-30/gluconolactonase/LRE family protein [Rhodospirillaceae bacterium]MBT5840177.1 SMP-30/gluconolactonase/LRE family protein [Rhodospirillaceae bacterium]
MSYRIEQIVDCENYLGEGPVWDVESGLFYWVDGTGRRKGKDNVFRMHPGTGKVESRLIADHDVGAIAVRENGGLVAAMDDGFYFYDFDSGDLELIAAIEEDQPRTRLNDGKTDRAGRFIAGGMDDLEELAICGLWRLDTDLFVSRIGGDIICTNGPCFSPDDKTFYVTDTFQEEIWAHDYDIETGAISNRRTFASTKGGLGICDGSTIDAEGYMWTAELVTGELVRRAPDGAEERRIGMPVKNITSVTFGGDAMDALYVTTMARIDHPGAAAHGRFAVETTPQYGAGSIFKVTGLGIRGIPEPRFGG